MKQFLVVIGSVFGGLAAIVLMLSLAFGAEFLSVQWYRFFGTQYESARTDIYRENKSYVEGTVRDLRELRVDYEKADEGHKEALKSLILHRANELDWDRLPADLRMFLEGLN